MLLAKQDGDLNWRSIFKALCYILPTFLNPVTCSCFVKNWEGVVKVTNYMIPNEVSWWEASLGTWREAPLKESCFNKLGNGVPLHSPIHTFTKSPKFLQPNWAASHPQPLSTQVLPLYQNKNKNKNSSRAEPTTLYKIVAILSTWAWQPTPQDSPIYIS